MTCQYTNFENIGFIYDKLTDEQISPIKQEINEIAKDFSEATSFNKNLIGHIQHQYAIKKNEKYIENLVMPYVKIYDNTYPNYMKTINVLTKSVPFVVKNPWVNFQKKFEFNPSHNHSGVYSFVIYIQIPYYMKDEEIIFKDNIDKMNGKFSFQYVNTLGNVHYYNIPIDKTYENTILFFPSKMIHSVNPFYTSDEYRISVAGNIYLNTESHEDII